MKISNLEVYEHLGHSSFNRDLFRPIRNRKNWVKPDGGLWASPTSADFGWSDWTKSNDFELDRYTEDSFRFQLRPSAKVLYIDSAEQLDDLPMQSTDIDYRWVVLDFEKLAQEYDAMEVLISKDQRLYWDLYGWDCDTLLVFNPDVIVEI